jgi:hypothetical protein
VIDLASQACMLLPAGITHHTINCGRAMGVNVQLSLLRADLATRNRRHGCMRAWNPANSSL